MPQYTLHYFNVRGLGELIRYIFVQAGQEFTDHRFEGTEWAEEKKNNGEKQHLVVVKANKKLLHLRVVSRNIIIRKHLIVELQIGSFHIKGGQACNPKSQKLLIFCGQIDNHEINTHTKFYFKIFSCTKNRAF